MSMSEKIVLFKMGITFFLVSLALGFIIFICYTLKKTA